MFTPLFLCIGQRYIRAKSNNRFVSFISLSSMLGIALGVMALITVLSVMNGFSREIQAKLLSSASHITISAFNGKILQWQEIKALIEKNPAIENVLPFINGQAMLVKEGFVQPVLLRGVPEEKLTDLMLKHAYASTQDLASAINTNFSIFIGVKLARALRADVDEQITLLTPDAKVSLAGVMPRFKRLHLSGIYKTNSYLDNKYAFISLYSAQKILSIKEGVDGIELQVKKPLAVFEIINELSNQLTIAGHEVWFSTWIEEYSTFFEAIKMEKTVMWCILSLIIAVAAFNLVASLIMMVSDKRKDIAVLRTIGMKAKDIMFVFIAQGTIIGAIGIVIGTILGLLLAYNVTEIVAFISKLFSVNFVKEEVYFISFVPSSIEAMDVIFVCVFALLLSIIATIYPALQASRVKPAEALRYD